MSDRQLAMREFLAGAGWGDALLAPISSDASTRHYVRLKLGQKHAILMDQPQGSETPFAPEGASEEERRRLGYNALARLAGADCTRYVAVANYLRALGLCAPEVHAADYQNGFLILEDLGKGLFTEVLELGEDEGTLYHTAVEVLAKMHASEAPSFMPLGPNGANEPLKVSSLKEHDFKRRLYPYDQTALMAETGLLIEWFLPLALGRAASSEEISEEHALWKSVLMPITQTRHVFVHRDYHAQNLLWRPKKHGLARVGLIDFQDAVAGSQTYDLISLIEDARRDVRSELAEWTTARYLALLRAQGAKVDEWEFRQEMAVMAAQRNAKIVGIFARLYRRDAKPRYLQFLPRVWRYLEQDLAHPALLALKQWYDRVIPREKRLLASMESL